MDFFVVVAQDALLVLRRTFITYYFCYCCSLCTRTCIGFFFFINFHSIPFNNFLCCFGIVVFVRRMHLCLDTIFFKQYLSALKCLREEEGSGKFLKLSNNCVLKVNNETFSLEIWKIFETLSCNFD